MDVPENQTINQIDVSLKEEQSNGIAHDVCSSDSSDEMKLTSLPEVSNRSIDEVVHIGSAPEATNIGLDPEITNTESTEIPKRESDLVAKETCSDPVDVAQEVTNIGLDQEITNTESTEIPKRESDLVAKETCSDPVDVAQEVTNINLNQKITNTKSTEITKIESDLVVKETCSDTVDVASNESINTLPEATNVDIEKTGPNTEVSNTSEEVAELLHTGSVESSSGPSTPALSSRSSSSASLKETDNVKSVLQRLQR